MARLSRRKRVQAGSPDDDPAWIVRVRAGLAAWYARGHRDLPWRRDRDPYRILVSELMLVQTTVVAVVPYFERFVARFPTVEALAAADEGEVLKLWEGLGYYRRARQLHAAARAIVERHGGRVPDDPEALRALPGVGRYVAGAVLSLAYDQPAPILEANTRRVLARLLAWREPLPSTAGEARLWQAAGRLVPEAGAAEFNQALMELGATVCLPRRPLCLLCPVAASCRARALGLQEAIPATAPRPAPLEVSEACALVVRERRFLMVRRAAGQLWEHFWEFPTMHVAGADPARRAAGLPDGLNLAEAVERLTSVRVKIGSALHTVRFGVTRHRVTLTAHAAHDIGGDPRPGPGLDRAAWIAPMEIAELTLGSAMRRLAAWAVERGGASGLLA
jgi:A/G-specific adenine glycosylase